MQGTSYRRPLILLLGLSAFAHLHRPLDGPSSTVMPPHFAHVGAGGRPRSASNRCVTDACERVSLSNLIVIPFAIVSSNPAPTKGCNLPRYTRSLSPGVILRLL